MFSEKDVKQIEERGSEVVVVEQQIANFKKGFPFLQIEEAASVGNGIIKLTDEELEQRISLYNDKLLKNIKPLKFIPASGAASRMFKSLFEAAEDFENGIAEEVVFAKNSAAKVFVDNFEKFAFAAELKSKIEKNS